MGVSPAESGTEPGPLIGIAHSARTTKNRKRKRILFAIRIVKTDYAMR